MHLVVSIDGGQWMLETEGSWLALRTSTKPRNNSDTAPSVGKRDKLLKNHVSSHLDTQQVCHRKDTWAILEGTRNRIQKFCSDW